MMLFIRNMVCNRCITAVKSELEKLGVQPLFVDLGKVEIANELDSNKKYQLEAALNAIGFELINDKNARLIEQIKLEIRELVHHQDSKLKTNLSDFLSLRLKHDYNSLSALFSEIEGTTIEKFYIAQKIERVKELLVYDELSLSEIAYQLNYSSLAYLSNQFKKVTGLSPSFFKRIKGNKRKPLDQI